MELIKCTGLTKVYGKGDNSVTALNSVDLSIEQGEFVTVVGASGSGKSTLLHLIGGLDTATSGSVKVDDIELSGLSRKDTALFRRRKAGIVYQFYNLIPTLTVERNIMIPMLLDKRIPDKDFLLHITDTLGITDKLKCYPDELSGGQQQRTAIARALIYRPALLLADEPTGNLDRKNSMEITEMLKLTNRNFKQTIILVTHDDKVALAADRIITIEDGSIISDEKRR